MPNAGMLADIFSQCNKGNGVSGGGGGCCGVEEKLDGGGEADTTPPGATAGGGVTRDISLFRLILD